VLVVEDDADFAESLVDLFEPLGFSVVVAPNAASALDALASFRAELALVDVKLGADDGVELVPMLKRRRPSLVCILMTAYASLESAVNAVKNGADDYLFKPFEPSELGRRVQHALDEAESVARAEREQRLLLLGHLCAGVAHDVNNYLQVILLDVEDGQTALSSAPPEVNVALDRLQSVSSAVDASADICHRMLKFAKGQPSSGRADAAAVVRESERLLARLISPGATLRVSAGEDPIWIGCGAIELQQVLMNLVRNAGQALSERGIVSISLERDGRPGHVGAHLTVADDGCGMAEDLLPRIFEPYFSTKVRHEGSGLGLSTVHGIVRSAGGEIRVRSELGRGTHFDIYLPEVEPQLLKEPSALVALDLLAVPRQVLIVDDSASLLGIMERVFRRHGFGVVGAASAESAFEQFRLLHASLSGIICDISLPGMSGLELASLVRELRPDFPVALTSGDDCPAGIEALGARAAFFRKPYSVRQIIDWFGAPESVHRDDS
jgi:signal transduction histidine kinase